MALTTEVFRTAGRPNDHIILHIAQVWILHERKEKYSGGISSVQGVEYDDGVAKVHHLFTATYEAKG